jgi:cytochrome c peroxidase
MLSLLTIILVGCQDDVDNGFPVDEIVVLSFPNYFPEMTYQSVPLSKNKIELGRRLFYEGKLSRNNTISCGFCHIQEFAFTHHGHPVSHGIDNRIGIRNAPPIQNMAFLNRFMWDGVIHNLDEQAVSPISAFEEMDSNFSEVIQKLKNDNYYPNLFKAAFGDSEINADRILNALGQFMATMISKDSNYDKYLQGNYTLTNQEENGRILFEQKCSVCHRGALQTDESFRNTGHFYNAQFADGGLFRVTLDSLDFMKFRVPSLRNVELTAPYMHDGRFYSLEAVLNFYSDGVEDHANLDPILKQNGVIGIPMNSQEKSDIIAFLKTLTDLEFIQNPNFSEF